MAKRLPNSISQGLKPDPILTITQWADKYRQLPKESAKEFGRYRTIRTPYVGEIMDELSPTSRANTVVFVKPTQVGATEIGINLLFYVADMFPGPCMLALPTGEMAKRVSKKRVAPAIRVIPRLREKIKKARARDSGNTIGHKEFPGGSWIFTGSNSPVAARSEAIKILILDDYDGFEEDVGGEGEPGDLFCKRTDTYGDSKKIYKNSTPTVKHFSNIEREYERSSKGFYHVPCPFCGEFIKMLWGYLKFDKKNVQNETIYLECPECQGKIKEYYKTSMLEKGKYIHEEPDNPIRGFKVNGLYSPLGWVSWKQIIDEFLEAKPNREKLKVWTNTRMAETFEEEGDQPEWTELKARCEPYEPLRVPMRGLFLSAGVDTHKNRLDVVIRAWGKGEESWLILWTSLYGDPGKPEVWKQLDSLIERDYEHESGVKLKLRAVSVDSGGHHTQDVYNYCRMRMPIVTAIQGLSTRGKPIVNMPSNVDVDYMGKKIKGGAQLWGIGTDAAKMTIYRRLKLQEKGAGYYHFYIGLEDEYFQQLTAERLITKYIDNFPRMRWVVIRPGEANHALDCEVYCYHAALREGMAIANWDQVEKDLKRTKPKPKEDQQMPRPSSNGWNRRGESWFKR